uniref:Uncharacterized mitochondrial protein AtMg00810-like n=1 Tax=Nicotiana tabacum TaxID=4097 RepID=A0A1S3XCP4_TOBAC|nr:PREDICTED: uncharacterized mitochondrial protein AtMg00810-like [Nicotiana tabacum]
MSMMGELTFFLGLQIQQSKEGTFICQTKYTKELIQNFGMSNAKAIGIPMSPSTSLDKDELGKSVDETKYRGMIGSFLYLTTSQPDIMFSVCKCARFQSAPKESHLTAIKKIIRYLIGTISHGLWYPHSNTFKLEGFSDVDLAGDKEDRKSTSGTCQLLEDSESLLLGRRSLFNPVRLHYLESPCQKLCPNQNPSMAKHSKTLSASTRKSTRSKEKPPSMPPEPVDLGSDHSEGFASS